MPFEWEKQGRKLRIAINFSVNLFSDSEFYVCLVDTEERSGLGSEEVVLNVTKTRAMNIPLDASEALMSLCLK
jgi:EAL domain-containing protein (putative c-di-GMP-specific phosphodiesterase class I)